VAEGGTSPSSLERMVFFSDAVFAIAITLLVLPLADSRFTDEDLGRQILELAPKTFSFVLSFLVIGLLWIGHNRAFALISRVDRKLMFLNLLVLMTVAYLPFPTALLGEHGNTTAAAALYGAGPTGLLLALLWAYASHGRPSSGRTFQRMPSATSGCVPTSFPCVTYRASLSLLCR
jgi:uncharacterized membrane protein